MFTELRSMSHIWSRRRATRVDSKANKRPYDAWGDVDLEQSVQPNDPSQRYCANLGHVQDDESDLIYMRARYYEANTGRFTSEDREHDGKNWFVYCDNIPSMRADVTGNASAYESFLLGFIVGMFVNIAFGSDIVMASANSLACAIVTVLVTQGYDATKNALISLYSRGREWMQKSLKSMIDKTKKLPPGSGGAASALIIAVSLYSGYIAGQLFMMEHEMEQMP